MLKKLVKPFLLLFIFTILNATDIDLDKIVEVAKKQNKTIMLFHHIPGCPYCKAMLDDNFKDENTLKQIDKNFIYVDIYTKNQGSIKFQDFQGTYKEFSQYIGAIVYPSTIFINGEGKVIYRVIGYRNIDEYHVEMSYVSTKSYKTMDLESYSVKYEFEKDEL